ncbi:RNA-splicing factor [Massospora cicadina]|nr:RNA-splicing factor [Massospora cicadina]
MGGGDLNFKKSWHPLRLHNQEKVWKEEKKAEEEAKRLAQLQKEIEEQRQLEEMQQLQEKAGLKKRSNQLDWMYTSGGAHASGGIDEDKEAYLLGSRKVDKLLAASEQEAAFSLSSEILNLKFVKIPF